MKRKNVIILVLAALLLISLLTACGSNVSFKIDFIVDGAVIHTIDTKGNEEIQVPADPEKEGYIFDGWYWDKDTWEKPFTANSLLNAPLSENMSVYAKWKTEGENEVQTYTITFNSNGGSDVYAITKEVEESVDKPTEPTKVGYSFDGWFIDNETFANEYIFSTMPAESFTLYAKWTINQYTISFNSNGGSDVVSITQDYNTEVLAPAEPIKGYYTFSGWFVDNETFENEYVFSIITAQDISLHAKWVPNKYPVSFFIWDETEEEYIEEANIEVPYGQQIIIPELLREGYSINNWYTDQEKTLEWNFNNPMPGDTVILYGNWTINQYTISFNSNGGSDVVSITQDYNTEVLAPAEPIKGYYTFSGWFVDNETFENEYVFSIITAQDISLHAKWVPNKYPVSFFIWDETEEEYIEEANIEVPYGQQIIIPKLLREGYSINNWYTDQEKTLEWNFNNPMPGGTVILYGNWTINQYTISFNSNGGSEVTAITKEAGVSITAPTAPTRTGYTFGGWYTDNGTFENAFEFDVMPAESLILYAKWIGESDYTPGLFFSEIDGGYGVSKGTATAENIVIPAEYNGKSVTSIGDGAFYYCYSLTSIAIPDSVTSIGDRAFHWCTSLTSITIPDSVTSIGDGAFCGCTSLTSITIPDSVTSIGVEAFYDCTSLTSITIPDSVTSIGDGAFSYCSSLTSITIPDSVTSIGDVAFMGCASLSSIIIPNTVTTIGAMPFMECTSLTIYAEASSKPNGWHDSWNPDNRPVVWGYNGEEYTITFDSNGGSNVAAITKKSGESIIAPTAPTKTGYIFNGWYTDNGTFENAFEFDVMPAESLILYAKWMGESDYTPGLSFTEIDGGYSVSRGTATAENIVIPAEYNGQSVIAIADNAFSQYGGSLHTSIIIPDSVTSIGDNAFSWCNNLTSITIPKSVTSIGNSAFSYCTGLTSITIPKSVTSIGDGAFYYCYSLTSIAIPDSVTSIGDRAFHWCTSLTSITIPDSVTSIGDGAFSDCTSLTSITIPDSVTSIGDRAFSYCSSLTSITIPDSVTSIGDRAFSSCSSLTSITIPDSVTSIGDWAFAYCYSLTSITIPDSVTSIGAWAFSDCTSLTSITIPDSVTSIGYYAFYVCSSLTSIEVSVDNINYKSIEGVLFNKAGTELIQYPIGNSKTSYDIPISVTSIGCLAFYGCSSLTSITIPDSVTSIGYYAFYVCSSLTSIEVSVDNINYKSIEGVLFNKAGTELIQYPIGNSKTSYDIPISVTSIGDRAFSYCSSLTSITIPDSVTSIGDRAFSYCSSLTSITIPDSVTSIGDRAFSSCSSLTIYAEASSKPNGWHDSWNPDNRPVVWGYAGQEDTYMITFNSNGGGDVSAITKEAGESITAPTAPTKTGYTFDGWYTDNNIFIDEYIFNTMPEESFILYAKWQWNGQNEYAANGYYRIENYIWFGEYPQTIKANDVTAGTTTDSRGYYLGSDGYYYAKVTATPNNSNYKFSTNATVNSGTVYYFKVEPIKWRILEESDGTALILCESIIANKRYHASNNYMNSEIRAWLNNEFYNTAFSALQKELIQTTNVDNSVYSTGYSSNPYTCANTNDKIFLPSYRDMVNTVYGFSSNGVDSDTARRRLTSDYSRATGAYMTTDTSYYGNGYWWLRSPSNSSSNIARIIYYSGNADYSNYVGGTIGGVVPALKIRL